MGRTDLGRQDRRLKRPCALYRLRQDNPAPSDFGPKPPTLQAEANGSREKARMKQKRRRELASNLPMVRVPDHVCVLFIPVAESLQHNLRNEVSIVKQGPGRIVLLEELVQQVLLDDLMRNNSHRAQ